MCTVPLFKKPFVCVQNIDLTGSNDKKKLKSEHKIVVI